MLGDTKVLCPSFIDGIPPPLFSMVLSPGASYNQWHLRLDEIGQLQLWSSFCCCCVILLLDSICRRPTISMDLMNFLGFYILYYVLKQGVPNCTYLCNQSNRILPWSLLNFILLALACYSHLSRSFQIMILSLLVLANSPLQLSAIYKFDKPNFCTLSKLLMNMLSKSVVILQTHGRHQ